MHCITCGKPNPTSARPHPPRKYCSKACKPSLAYHRKWRYGITAAEVAALLEQQAGVCALCRRKPATDVDHDHTTDRIRGMLCRSCNVALGQLGDSIEGLLNAVRYLRGQPSN